MKRFATALVLLLLTLTLSIGAQLIFSKKTDELITGLEALLCAVDAGEGEERALENVEKAWLGSKKILHILLVHRSMDEIEININSLCEYLGAGDREALRQACTEALMQLENLRDAGRITIENILKIA